MTHPAVCVFCGSSLGARPEYRDTAIGLGRWLAAHGVGLIYGGTHVGLMGAVADACLTGGGRVVGVIPDSLAERELAHLGLTELVRVDSMHERKAEMARRATAFVALPGALGTLDELCEILTWSQLGFHSKPVGLLNVAGYYDAFLSFLDHTVAEGFLRQSNRDRLIVAATVGDLLPVITSK